MRRKKKKFNKKKHENITREQILKFTNYIPLHDNFVQSDLDLNSWIKSKKYRFKTNKQQFNFIEPKKTLTDIKENNKIYFYKCIKIIIYPSERDKIILQEMIKAYNKLYNMCIKYFNTCIYNKKILITELDDILRMIEYDKLNNTHMIKYYYICNYMTIRTHILNNDKINIMKEFKDKTGKNINSHMLDDAIKCACAMLKSALSNLQSGHIKHFKLRYIKETKNTHVIGLEKTTINKDGNKICGSILNDIILNNSKFNYTSIKCDFKIHYNKLIDRYTLLIPQLEYKTNNTNENTYISCDPGYKTLLTGITNNKKIEIGTNLQKFLSNNVKHQENIKEYLKKNNTNKLINKLKELKIRQQNKLEDAYWKISNYLTKNYKYIICGKWNSSTRLTNNISSQLDKEMKAICFYKLIQKLQYKCNANGNIFILTNEAYTTKLCSNCGTYKDIGISRIYNCNNCNRTYDRDFNSSKNILCKSIESIKV